MSLRFTLLLAIVALNGFFAAAEVSLLTVRRSRLRQLADDGVLVGGQAISQPYIVAWMTELLQVVPGGLVLEIGTGSGYQAAVLATIGARVRSIERLPELAAAANDADALSIGMEMELVLVPFRTDEGGDGSLSVAQGATEGP